MGFPPRLHGGRLFAGMTGRRARFARDSECQGAHSGDAEGEGEESVIGGEIPRLGLAAFGMTMALGKPPKGMKMDSV